MLGIPETKDISAVELSASRNESYALDGQIITGNNQDAIDMVRLGKKQEFRRNFNFISTLGFISTYMETWEFVLVSLGLGLINGGFAGLFWTFIGTITCYSTVVLSLAEMASMAPTSGGQYHWVSEFAPESCQKFLSYSAGWMSTLGWLASTASSVFVCAAAIESVVEVQPQNTDWSFLSWQFVLLMLGLLLITIVFNTWMARLLPLLETIGLFGHLAGFIVVLVALVVMCPKNSASDVFTTFVDSGGWGNVGVACLVAQSSILYCNLGSDSIVHIAEEVDDASLVVPKVMWWSYILNTILGIAMLITMLFCIGPLEDALNTDSPYLQLFDNTGSVGVATLLCIVVLLLLYVGNVTCLATSSREVFAFARDKGFPFSSWLAKINRHNHVPYNAVYAVSFWAGVICLIDLGSTFAFNIVVSLNLLALVSTYALSIGCVTLKRMRGKELPPARWSLGKWGLPINMFAVAYCIFVVIWSSFPAALPVSLDSANWAPAIWVGVFLLSIITYLLHGKTHYTAPVIFTEGKRSGGLQSST